MIVFIVGGGRVGTALARVFDRRQILCFVVRANSFDAKHKISDPKELADHYVSSVNEILIKSGFNDRVLVINTVAYTDVEGCQINPDLAYSINTKFPYLLYSRLTNIQSFSWHFINLSTDMMFNSGLGLSASEDSIPGPVNVYAKSKFLGDSLLVGLSGVSVVRGNFLFRSKSLGLCSFLEYLERSDSLAFTSCVFSPATIDFAASVLLRLYEETRFGLFHVCSSPIEKSEFVTSYLEYVGRDVDALTIKVQDPTAQSLVRPRNMSLCSRFEWCFDDRPLSIQLGEVE